MVHLGMANSRMKDFFDLWFLAQGLAFDGATLATTIGVTIAKRRMRAFASRAGEHVEAERSAQQVGPRAIRASSWHVRDDRMEARRRHRRAQAAQQRERIEVDRDGRCSVEVRTT